MKLSQQLKLEQNGLWDSFCSFPVLGWRLSFFHQDLLHYEKWLRKRKKTMWLSRQTNLLSKEQEVLHFLLGCQVQHLPEPLP